MSPTRPIRVAHVITHLDVGGATEVAANACAHLDRRLFDSVLLSGPPPNRAGDAEEGDFGRRARALGVRVVIIPHLRRSLHPLRDPLALRAVRRVLREERPDIVHTHSSKGGVLGRLAARQERVPAILHTVHGWSFHDFMPGWQQRTYASLERRAARWSHRLITVCDTDRTKGLAAGVGTLDQYRTIHALTDLDPYFAAPTRAAARARLGLPIDAPIVGTVGRLSEQKDPITFLRAAARIAAEVPGAGFVMVGDGPLRADVESHARALGLSDRLLLAGLRDDVHQILPAFDAFLLSSRWEGLPLVIPQAMAAGVPVVATSVDGVPEVVRDGETGLLGPPQAAKTLAAGAVKLLEDAALRVRLTAAGRDAARGFALETTVPQLTDLYVRCASESRRPVAQ